MLYVGTREPLLEQVDEDLRVEPVEPARRSVLQWFTQPSVQFVGAHTHCSCGFPHVLAESPIEYFDGLWSDDEDRQADIRSMRALSNLLRDALGVGQCVELYPVGDGNEGCAPKGRVDWYFGDFAPERTVFTEQFFYVVRNAGSLTSA